MKKTKPFTAKQLEYLNRLNTQRRMHLCLTGKQIEAMLSSLKSTAQLRGTETEREYFRKIIKTIEEQV